MSSRRWKLEGGEPGDPGASGGHPAGGRDPWVGRWTQLALGCGLSPTEPVLLALSGGADSVYLLHTLARARPRPRVLAVHVDHRLRGAESTEDGMFCARLCARLQVPFARAEVEIDPDAPNLEARAREARYRALADQARAAGLRTILTGHHEDDALETLLLRWMRGSALPGLAGLKPRNVLAGGTSTAPEDEARAVTVVRPLLSMRREEVRRLLRDAGFTWREDSSNASPRFTRNRVRSELLPQIEEACGEGGFENLRAFASAVESLEEELASRTAHLAWDLPAWASALGTGRGAVGGRLARAELGGLAPPLLRRALWRLLVEGTGEPPGRALLAILEDDLLHDAAAVHTLPGGWRLELAPRELVLSPPPAGTAAPSPPAPSPSVAGPRPGTEHALARRPAVVREHAAGSAESRAHAAEPRAPAAEPRAHAAGPRAPATGSPGTADELPERGPVAPGTGVAGPLEWTLVVPGELALPDGRCLRARWVDGAPDRPVPRDPHVVELELPAALAFGADGVLTVRGPRAGDRFHPLGAPGSRPLRRFLADAGVPRALRPSVRLVLAGERIVWVAGLRPAESCRSRGLAALRLRLEWTAQRPARAPQPWGP